MQPVFSVTANGSPIFGGNRENLSITLTDCAGFENDRVEFKLNDDPGIIVPPIKTVFGVSFGYAYQPGAESRYNGVMQYFGTFVLDEVKFSGPPRELSLTAHANFTGNDFKKMRDRDWHQKTIGEIVEKIAGETGLTPRIDPGVKDKFIEHIDQANASNMQFLTNLGHRFDAVAKVSEGVLYFGEKGKLKSVGGGALTPTVVYESECTEWNGLVQTRGEFDGVKARYNDLATAEEKFEIEGKEGITKILPHRYATKDEAKDAAKGHHNDMAKEKETFSFTCVGNPTLVAEQPVILFGFRPGLRPMWVADRVVHTLSATGFTSKCECKLPDAASKDADVEGRE